MLGIGILQAIAPTVAQHVGAGRREAIGPGLQQGFWLAIMLAVPGTWLLRHPDCLLQLSEMSPEIEEGVRGYLATIAWGLPAVFLYRSFYAFCNAIGRTHVLMLISFSATLIHIPLSWLLIQGGASLAPLGGTGCALSSACIAWFALAASCAYLQLGPPAAEYQLFKRWQAPRWRPILALLRLGLPMGFSSFVEITAFTLISLFVARLGSDVVASHRIVGNLSALIYMLPLALAVATLVVVGQAIGADDHRAAQRAAWTGVALACSLSTLVSIALWLARESILAAYSDDPEVRRLAGALVFYICLYQFFDAIQTVAAHALRGHKITFGPMLVHTLCFWGVGLAGGYRLAFTGLGDLPPQGVAGFWQACVASNIAAALIFGLYLYRIDRAAVATA
jgi:MATE family multidrug resistance protein